MLLPLTDAAPRTDLLKEHDHVARSSASPSLSKHPRRFAGLGPARCRALVGHRRGARLHGRRAADPALRRQRRSALPARRSTGNDRDGPSRERQRAWLQRLCGVRREAARHGSRNSGADRSAISVGRAVRRDSRRAVRRRSRDRCAAFRADTGRGSGDDGSGPGPSAGRHREAADRPGAGRADHVATRWTHRPRRMYGLCVPTHQQGRDRTPLLQCDVRAAQ